MCSLALYALFILYRLSFFGCLTFVRAGDVNITVDDTDPSIIYQPDTAWYFNGDSLRCTFCLTPPSRTIAYNSTWHHGLNVILTRDMDDLSKGGVDDDASVMRRGRSGGKLVVGRRDPDNSTYDPTNGATTSPFMADELDAENTDFPVSVQLNFTGSAIYLFCVLPLGVPPNNYSTPTLMNLSFTLDGEPAGSFFHNGSTNTGGFRSDVPVLSRGNLSDSVHNLLVDLGPNSVFLLDYYVFSQSNESNNGSHAATGIRYESATTRKKHNVRTFAGAVGGSVGVLAAVSTCVAISIYRRRRRSARQHPRDREPQSDARSFHTDASEDPPEMQGPAPFTPRYFPGTTPLAPPPYTGSTGPPILSSHLTSSAAAPDAVHDTEPLDVPPPFSVAVSSPVPPVLLDAMRQTIPQIPPPSFVEDGHPALPEVAEAVDPIPQSPQQIQSTHSPVPLSDTPAISPTHLASGNETEAPSRGL